MSGGFPDTGGAPTSAQIVTALGYNPVATLTGDATTPGSGSGTTTVTGLNGTALSTLAGLVKVVSSTPTTATATVDYVTVAQMNAAIAAYVGNPVNIVVWDYDSSTGLYPSTGGTGAGGAIQKDNAFLTSVAGTVGGVYYPVHSIFIANIDNPGQTAGNWTEIQGNLGYIPENAANKNASGGYPGLSGFGLVIRNAANTFQSVISSLCTTNQTVTLRDGSGTLAFLTDCINQVLTGLSTTAGTVSSSDSVVAAIGKIVGNIAALNNYASAYIGTTSVAFNRASASQSLTGVSIDGSAGSTNTLNGVTVSGTPAAGKAAVATGSNTGVWTNVVQGTSFTSLAALFASTPVAGQLYTVYLNNNYNLSVTYDGTDYSGTGYFDTLAIMTAMQTANTLPKGGYEVLDTGVCAFNGTTISQASAPSTINIGTSNFSLTRASGAQSLAGVSLASATTVNVVNGSVGIYQCVGSNVVLANPSYTNYFFAGAGYGSTGSLGSNNLVAGVYAASASNYSGNYNIIYGHQAGQNLTTGSSNTLYGYSPGLNLITGHNNNLIGSTSGYSITTGNYNTILGNYYGTASLTGACVISDGNTTSNVRYFCDSTGRTGLNGITSPTAQLHIAPGNASAGNAPIKVNSGVILTTPEAGTIEYNGNWYITDSTPDRKLIARSNYTAATFSITPPTSGTAYQNTTEDQIDVIVNGGVVTLIEFSRNNTNWFTTGLTSGMFTLSQSDFIRVTYSSAPTMTGIPR